MSKTNDPQVAEVIAGLECSAIERWSRGGVA